MTGRGRAGRGKRDPARPAQLSHCSEDEEKPPPSGANAKRNSERSSRKPTGANGGAHTATTMKKSSASSGAVKSVSCGPIPPTTNGDVKPKHKREPARKTSTPVRKGKPAQTASNAASNDTTDSKKTDSIAPVKPESSLHAVVCAEHKNNSICPSQDGPASPVEKKKVVSAAKNSASGEKVLQTTLDKLKIKMTAKVDSSCRINAIVDTIIKHMKQKSEHFRDVHKMCTGSYYENVKVRFPI